MANNYFFFIFVYKYFKRKKKIPLVPHIIMTHRMGEVGMQLGDFNRSLRSHFFCVLFSENPRSIQITLRKLKTVKENNLF